MKGFIDICGCKYNYKTNYPGFYLRDTSKCAKLPTTTFPPSDVNVEAQSNIKFDYLSFESKNRSTSVYEALSDTIQDSIAFQVFSFLQTARRENKMKLFNIKGPIFGLIRGDMIRQVVFV